MPTKKSTHRRRPRLHMAGGVEWSKIWEKLKSLHHSMQEKKPISKLLSLVPGLSSAQLGPVPVGSILTGLRDYAGYGKHHRTKRHYKK